MVLASVKHRLFSGNPQEIAVVSCMRRSSSTKMIPYEFTAFDSSIYRGLPQYWDSPFDMRASLSFLLALCILSGCHSEGEPKVRVGCYPTATPGMTFIGLKDLGPHGYGRQPDEGNGIVYTCRAGHIDIAHVRACADWTKYIAQKAYACLLENQTQFSFKSNVESTRHHVDIGYPPGWASLPPKRRDSLAWNTAVNLSQYLIFTAATWHEILTWFGHRYLSPFPEFPSAFSWEDSYSNLLGTHLAGQVLHEGPQDYDRRFTHTLKAELRRLQIQPQANKSPRSSMRP